MATNNDDVKETHLFQSKLLTWRQSLSPLRGLTIQRYVQLTQNSQMGLFADLQWLYLFVERRDAVLKAVMERRISSIKKLDWAIKIKKGMEEDKNALAQKQYLEDVYSGIDNIREVIEHLATASFRGFALAEKHTNADGDVFHIEPVPQHLWAMKMPSKEYLYNAKSFATATGIPIKMENFLIREEPRPIDEIASLLFIRKGLSTKDWDGAIETYGIPPLFITLPQGVGSGTPQGTPGASILDTYQQLADQVISDGRGVLPYGATVVNPTKEVAHSLPFQEHIRYCDEQIVLAATSGLLTSLSAPTGLGNSGQGQAHETTFNELARAEARTISEVFQKQLDGPALLNEFPSQEAMVYFDLAHNDIEDADPIDDAKNLAAAGYLIDVDELSEKTGYTLTLKPQPGQGQPGGQPGGNGFGAPSPAPDQDPELGYDGGDSYNDWLKPSVQNSVKPLADAIKNVIELPDDKLMNSLQYLAAVL